MAEETNVAPATEATTTEAVVAKPATKRKKNKRAVAYGQLHVLATFNNTIVTFTDQTGGVLTQASAGGCGFRGSKKGTAYAAQIAAEKAGNLAKTQHGLSKVDVYVKGIGQGRDTAVRALSNLDIAVESITDVTGIAHGGVRPRKARRN
ncbi:30S ribosomal protein S11 [Candidatus Saccharibacteria bacterium]|nr:30S ribosomal protein S11 [Candidatus Saccharibacteria bacterium]MCA9328661.1 30S ribosomal protein S11 [Candidatus Saccharibacteria bacterium]